MNVKIEEWRYAMRREMQEILPGLFLGPYSAAIKSKYNTLLNRQITHIVCIRQSAESHFIRPNFPNTFKYLILDIKDSPTEIIIPSFKQVSAFLDDCFSCGGKALIHGNLGISRSGAIVIAYVMERLDLNFREAFNFVQFKRFCVSPNEGFRRQLMEYEPIYQAKKMLHNRQSPHKSGTKRHLCNS